MGGKQNGVNKSNPTSQIAFDCDFECGNID